MTKRMNPKVDGFLRKAKKWQQESRFDGGRIRPVISGEFPYSKWRGPMPSSKAVKWLVISSWWRRNCRKPGKRPDELSASA